MSGYMRQRLKAERQERKGLAKLIIFSLILHSVAFAGILLVPTDNSEASEIQVTKVRLIDAPFEGIPRLGPAVDAVLELPGGLPEPPLIKPKALKKLPEKVTPKQKKPLKTDNKPKKKKRKKKKVKTTSALDDAIASIKQGKEKKPGSSPKGKIVGNKMAAKQDPCNIYKRRRGKYMRVKGSVPEAKGKSAVIRVVISASGRASVTLTKSSGNSIANRVALSKVRRKYPAPPPGCAPVVLRIRAKF